jgi:glycosyltransferase involved in cell wall biosynthesis
LGEEPHGEGEIVATIGLSMIVKNEAKLILRCLNSVLPLIDHAVICDTGSTDGTPEIIRTFLSEHNMPGKVIDDPWINFAANRNRALLSLNQHKEIDYAFVIDADDTLEIADGFDMPAFKSRMTYDVYDLMVEHASVIHPRPQIFRNTPAYSWKGVLHEYVAAPDAFTRATELGLKIKATIEGSRNADPEKFKKDAEILEKALISEKNEYLRARYTFYLAQSYRDAEEPEKALKAYLTCSNMSKWDQEVYVSLLEAIRCCIKLKAKPENSLDFLNRAAKAVPNRAEAHHAMAFFCRQGGKNHEGMEIARSGLHLKQPDGLFIEPWVYDYGLRDEYAVNAYWAGFYLESLEANLQLLASPKTPAGMVQRLGTNACVSLDKLKPRLNLVYSD